jgi:xanthine dehydrogenase accessory factor
MRDIVDGLQAWRAEGVPFALATVVRTTGTIARTPDDRATVAVYRPWEQTS